MQRRTRVAPLKGRRSKTSIRQALAGTYMTEPIASRRGNKTSATAFVKLCALV